MDVEIENLSYPIFYIWSIWCDDLEHNEQVLQVASTRGRHYQVSQPIRSWLI